MPLFNYRAVDARGKTVKGSIYARDLTEVKRLIRENGLTAVKVVKGNDVVERLNKLTVKKVAAKDIAVFCRQLHIILSSGVNILNGLDILKRQIRGKVMKNVLTRIHSEVQKGSSMSEAMASMDNMLPTLLINMVSVGEVSGNLDEILKRMAQYYDKETFMREKLKSAMVYPIILSVLGLGMLIFFMYFVMPEILKVITESGGELPGLTKAVIGITAAVKKYYLVFLGLLAGILILVNVAIPKEKLRYYKDKLLINIPVVGLSLRTVVTSRFMRTVSMMLKGGIPILHVLGMVERILGNAVAEQGIRRATDGVKRGERLAENIDACKFFDPLVIHMISIGEETGELDNILENMADYYDREAEALLMKMMSTVEPLFTVILGAVIGILIISMVIPMFSMLSQLSPQQSP